MFSFRPRAVLYSASSAWVNSKLAKHQGRVKLVIPLHKTVSEPSAFFHVPLAFIYLTTKRHLKLLWLLQFLEPFLSGRTSNCTILPFRYSCSSVCFWYSVLFCNRSQLRIRVLLHSMPNRSELLNTAQHNNRVPVVTCKRQKGIKGISDQGQN